MLSYHCVHAQTLITHTVVGDVAVVISVFKRRKYKSYVFVLKEVPGKIIHLPYILMLRVMLYMLMPCFNELPLTLLNFISKVNVDLMSVLFF